MYICDKAYNMCKHPNGCRLVQKLLEVAEESKTLPIINCLLDNFDMFVRDQYGNYVIQYIIEKRGKYVEP